MEKQFGLSDQVISRIAQIVQEGMMLGIDCVDLLRQMRMREDVSEFGVGSSTLVLTEDYKQQVRAMHEKLLAEAERLAAKSNDPEDAAAVEAFKLFQE